MPALWPFLEERLERRGIAGAARRRPGLSLSTLLLARFVRVGLVALQRHAAIRCLLGAHPVRKLGEEIGKLIERWSDAQRSPGQVFEPRTCEAFRHAGREA